MADPLQELLASGAVPTSTFLPTSRYADVGLSTYMPTAPPGQEPVPVAFLRRRLVPKPERFALLYEYTCIEGDRRDLLASTHLSDPELWWRIADANGVIDPAGLATPPGRRLRMTLADGVPGGIGG